MEAAPSSAYSQLRALEWLVGTWEDKAGDQTVEAKVKWAGDKNFLTRTFKVKGSDQNETDGWEIIGWDPGLRRDRVAAAPEGLFRTRMLAAGTSINLR